MPKEFSDIQQLVTFLSEQMIDIRADVAAAHAAAGIALSLMIQNSQNPVEAAEGIRQRMKMAFRNTTVTNGDPESDKKILSKAQVRLKQLGDDLARYAASLARL